MRLKLFIHQSHSRFDLIRFDSNFYFASLWWIFARRKSQNSDFWPKSYGQNDKILEAITLHNPHFDARVKTLISQKILNFIFSIQYKYTYLYIYIYIFKESNEINSLLSFESKVKKPLNRKKSETF